MLSELRLLLVACLLLILAFRWENKTSEWCRVAVLSVGPAASSCHSYLEMWPGWATCLHSVVAADLRLSFILLDDAFVSLEDYRPWLHLGALVILAICCWHSAAAPFSCQSAPREIKEMFASDH
jgi:hypothetical protein